MRLIPCLLALALIFACATDADAKCGKAGLFSRARERRADRRDSRQTTRASSMSYSSSSTYSYSRSTMQMYPAPAPKVMPPKKATY